MEEKRTAKVLWSKSGRGSDTTRLTLPIKWIREMGLTRDIRVLDLIYDNEKMTITISKSENQE